ncbi:hypothetical protein D8Y20_00520 [Mariprofundus sp. EBB-1]|nr:hypothetical protein D8Y20_00520 [Mariprofundus sp. EBB-1]
MHNFVFSSNTALLKLLHCSQFIRTDELDDSASGRSPDRHGCLESHIFHMLRCLHHQRLVLNENTRCVGSGYE